MGSSATDKAVKKSVKTKKDSGKKKVTKKAAKPRATAVKKKRATSRKKAVTTKKAVAKKKTVKKKAPRKKAVTKAVGKSVSTAEQHADASPTTPATPDHSSTTAAAQDGSRSLSWMAAQAASALKAVKANQNERAQVLMAKAEITPAAPAKPRKKVSPPVAADVSKALKDTAPEKPLEPATKKQQAKAKPAVEKAQSPAKSASPGMKQDTNTDMSAKPAKKEDAKKSLADNRPATQKEASPDTPPKPGKAVTEQAVKISPAKSAALAPESSRQESSKPESATPKTVKVPTVPATAAQPEPTVNTEQKQTSSPPAHVIANTATSGSKRSIRPMLLTAILILLGILGTRTWLGGDDTTDIATLQDSTATKQLSPAAAKPQHDTTSVVTVKTAVKPATNTTEANHWPPTTKLEWPEPTASQEPGQTVNTTTPAPNEIVVTETRQVQTTPQTTRPAVPQPGYYAPGYGYGYGNYQQQPARQQPYYQPAYARPSYLQ